MSKTISERATEDLEMTNPPVSKKPAKNSTALIAILAGVLLIFIVVAAFSLFSAPNSNSNVGTTSQAAPTLTKSNPTATPSAAASKEKELLSRASANFSKLNSLYLLLEIRQGKADVNGGEVKQVAGFVQTPDKYKADVKVRFFNFDINVPVIGIGGVQYMGERAGNWIISNPSQTFNLANLFDSEKGLAPLLLKVQNLQTLPDEELDGQPQRHLQGKISGADVAAFTFNKLSQANLDIEIWINSQSGQVTQFYLKRNEPDPVFWLFTFSKFDQPVTIQKP